MNFLFYRVFTKENATSFLRKSSSPFSLQELRPLTPLKATYRFTSSTVIGMTKIMCNKDETVNFDTWCVTEKNDCRKKLGSVLEVHFFPTIVEEHAQRM
jgi:hypothetical protein